MDINELQEKEYKRLKLREEKQLRLRLVYSVGPIAAGLIFYFVGRAIIFSSPFATTFSVSAITVLSSILSIAGLVNFLYWYLQTGFKTSEEHWVSFNKLKPLNISTPDNINDKSAIFDDIEDLKAKVGRIASMLEADNASFENLTETLKRKIELEAGSELLAKFRADHLADFSLEKAESKLNQAHATSSSRLSREIEALGRRGNLNLILGVFTTTAGLLALVYFILKNEQVLTEPLLYAMNFLPRLTLVIFIEVFAYFFLKLYKVGLSEIKYFQNELTNLESKHMALLAALRHNNSEILLKVIGALSDTERNHILEKGQTTIEIEKMQLEKNQLVEVAQTLASLFPKSK
ncbi:hypothetical protein [Pseudomonas sp. SC3(2021)]|uniref:hypothetical protein n=1 Tax=Pseudomonas sp. SC3(2021) TaxID=2871493 RepID=UPI001C9D8EEC|nr:hypothetical protein [Pseudomonas sp. SC3(2021)]